MNARLPGRKRGWSSTVRASTTVVLVAGGLLIAGCANEASGSAEPSKRTSAKSAAAKATTAPSADDGAVPRPSSTDPLPIRKGQWVRYDIQDGKGKRQFSYAVVGEEGDAHWLDISVELVMGQVVVRYAE